MKKWLIPMIASCFSIQITFAADDIFLEGIMMLGEKSAIVLNNGKQLTVKTGDTVGEWTVEAIEARQIFLKNTKGERKELKLKTNLNASVPATPTPATPADKPADAMTGMTAPSNPFAAAAAANAAAAKKEVPAPPTGQPPGQTFQPKIIEDKDIPPGHRRVRTPFGDVLVKDPPASLPVQ